MATSEPKPAGSPAKVDANNNATAPPAAPSESQATVVALANKYRAEFEETFEGLRQRAVKLQSDAPQFINETQASVEPYKQEFITTVQATGDVTTPPIVVLGTLAWASVLVLASTISMHLSALLLAPILSLAIGTCGALVLALGVIPVYTYWAINKEIEAKSADAKIRFQLLAVALVEGCLAGHILQYSYLSGAPLGALLLGVAAGAYPFAAEKFGGNRQMLLGASVGASAGVTMVLGLLTGYLTMPYLLLSLLYAAATAVCLQYMYKNVINDSTPTYAYQLWLLVSFRACHMLCHLLCGMGPEAYAKYKSG